MRFGGLCGVVVELLDLNGDTTSDSGTEAQAQEHHFLGQGEITETDSSHMS